MKNIHFYGMLSISLIFMINGCCKQFWPQKIVFTPELQMALDRELSLHDLEDPLVLVIGKSGKTIALKKDGNTFTPCRPPAPDKITDSPVQIDPSSENALVRTDIRTSRAVRKSKLPVCKGLQNAQKVFPVETVTIMKTRVNPFCLTVTGPDGECGERCFP